MQPTNNAVRRDASPLECSGDFCHGLLRLLLQRRRCPQTDRVSASNLSAIEQFDARYTTLSSRESSDVVHHWPSKLQRESLYQLSAGWRAGDHRGAPSATSRGPRPGTPSPWDTSRPRPWAQDRTSQQHQLAVTVVRGNNSTRKFSSVLRAFTAIHSLRAMKPWRQARSTNAHERNTMVQT